MSVVELTLTGSGRDRGRAHGESLRESIAAAIDDWFHSLSARVNPRDLVAELTHVSGLREAAEQHTPDLVDEVRGLAEGAAQPFETMFAWQAIDEAWWYLDEMNGGLVPVEHCSAFAINHDGHGIVGQTQDLPRHYDGHQVMLRYRDADGAEILAPSVAGLLALNGVNSHGLAVTITTLSQLAHSGSGVATGFLMPALLQCRGIDEALDLLARIPIASGNSFVIGTLERSVAVEVAADSMQVLAGDNQAMHTNHTLALKPVLDYVRFEGSVERLDQLDRMIQPTSTLEQIRAAYSAGAICRSRALDEPTMSIGTMFFELNETQLCHFAPGPLDTDALATYTMTGN